MNNKEIQLKLISWSYLGFALFMMVYGLLMGAGFVEPFEDYQTGTIMCLLAAYCLCDYIKTVRKRMKNETEQDP